MFFSLRRTTEILIRTECHVALTQVRKMLMYFIELAFSRVSTYLYPCVAPTPRSSLFSDSRGAVKDWRHSLDGRSCSEGLLLFYPDQALP